jgi:hypothetical protein
LRHGEAEPVACRGDQCDLPVKTEIRRRALRLVLGRGRA